MSLILLKIKMPRPWHFDVCVVKKVRVSWSKESGPNFAGTFWTTRRRSHTRWALKKWRGGNHINLTIVCYLVYQDLFWISWDFCWVHLFDKAHSTLWNDWLSLDGWSSFRRPNRFALFHTTWRSNRRLQFISILDPPMPCIHSFGKMF